MRNGKRVPAKKVEKLAWGLDEASEASGLSKGYLRKLIAGGELRIIRCGRRVLIPDPVLRELLDHGVRRAA